MVERPQDRDELTTLTDLMHFITEHTEHQFIAFVDSRKQTEQLASVMRRGLEIDPNDDEIDFENLERLRVYPYRAGYESADRKHIHELLRQRKVRGVISTSALEVGIDIPSLTMGILYGIPYSATSYFQRIGRIGRQEFGTIIVVNNGSILSNRIFRYPESLDTMPLAEGALYLDNPRIQYIHAMCLARPDGEDATLPGSDSAVGIQSTYVEFPETFLALCNRERIGEIDQEFQLMKAEAGNNPNLVFPLRDCDVQYQVELRSRTEPSRSLGSLSFSQVMRETYPGAVYYYQTQPYRVVSISSRQHKIFVRLEKRYTTKPRSIPTLVYPNLSEGNVYGALRYHDMYTVECNLQLRESIIGFKERRGPNEFTQDYPLDPNLGLFFDRARFERNNFSSGVLFVHPVLDRDNIDREMLAEILFEAFVIEIPFERQDLRFGSDLFRANRGKLVEGQRFLCVYDQTYESLRLTSRLMEPGVLRGVMEKALDIAHDVSVFVVTPATLDALETLYEAAHETPISEIVSDQPIEVPGHRVRIIMPGSVGLYRDYENEEFGIDAVFYSPSSGMMYRGKRLSKQGKNNETVTMSTPIDKIVPVEGRSDCGFYNYETGMTERIEQINGCFSTDMQNVITVSL